MGKRIFFRLFDLVSFIALTLITGESKTVVMRLRAIFALTLGLLIPSASAQITGGNYYGYNTASIPELFSQIFGISISNPYNLIGILATFSVMWVSAYVIFKVALQYLDTELSDDGYDKPFQDAVGLTDDDDTNILALLTLLITLTIIGTAGFMGLIRGWQSLILLAFTFMLLAGTIFVIIGGVGGTVAGSAYIAGKSGKGIAKGINETKEALDNVETRERDIEEEEDEEERDIDDGRDDEADEEAHHTAEEIDELENDIDNLRRIINLLGEHDA